jgi:hypothetical protein
MAGSIVSGSVNMRQNEEAELIRPMVSPLRGFEAVFWELSQGLTPLAISWRSVGAKSMDENPYEAPREIDRKSRDLRVIIQFVWFVVTSALGIVLMFIGLFGSQTRIWWIGFALTMVGGIPYIAMFVHRRWRKGGSSAF